VSADAEQLKLEGRDIGRRIQKFYRMDFAGPTGFLSASHLVSPARRSAGAARVF
jgi:hypothetical protein